MELGHHQLGTYHWAGLLAEGTRSLGFGSYETFRSPLEFAGLVTAVHETYHLLQGISLGTCLDYDIAQDSFATALSAFLRRQPKEALRHLPLRYDLVKVDPQSKAILTSRKVGKVEGAWLKFEHLEKELKTAEFSNRFLAQEVRASADPVSEGCKGITAEDLLETMAALLTERYVSWLIKMRPEAFNVKVLTDLAGIFRVEAMPQCRRVLSVFRKFVSPVIDPSSANADHPLFPACPNPVENDFLVFLTDYALHKPPLPEASAWPQLDTSDWQNLTPAVRFVKLMTAFVVHILEKKGQLGDLWTKMTVKLARKIRRADEMARRAEAKGKQAPLYKSPYAFLNFNATTREWQKLLRRLSRTADHAMLTVDTYFPDLSIYESNPDAVLAKLESRQQELGDLDALTKLGAALGLETRMAEFLPKQQRFLEWREKKPALLIATPLKEMLLLARIPRFWRTAIGVEEAPPVAAVYLDKGQKKWAMHGFGFDPVPFIEGIVLRRLYRECAKAIYRNGRLKCPLAYEFDFYQCPSRTAACSDVEVERLPEAAAVDVTVYKGYGEELEFARGGWTSRMRIKRGCLARLVLAECFSPHFDEAQRRKLTMKTEILVTEQLIEELHANSIETLKHVVGTRHSVSGEKLNLDADAFIDLLAWQIVLPFLLSLAAGLTIEIMKLLKDRSKAELREEAEKTVGLPLELSDAHKTEQCVAVVEELLKPLGVDLEGARQLVKALRSLADSAVRPSNEKTSSH